MNKTVRLIITILLLIVCLLFLSCNETGKKGRVLFTYVPDGLSLTAKQLKTEEATRPESPPSSYAVAISPTMSVALLFFGNTMLLQA